MKRKQSFFILIKGLLYAGKHAGYEVRRPALQDFKSMKGEITIVKKKKWLYGQQPGLFFRQSTTIKNTNLKVFCSVRTQIILRVLGYEHTALKVTKVCEADNQDRLTYISKAAWSLESSEREHSAPRSGVLTALLNSRAGAIESLSFS